MKSVVSTLLELAGITAVAAGLGLLAPWLGIAAAGVGLVLVGLAIDPPSRSGS